MSELNKELMRATFEMLNGGDLSRADEVIAPGMVDHEDMGGLDTNGPDGFKRIVSILRSAFPDLLATVEDMVAEDDLVVARYRMTGTHEGEFLGLPATGRRIDIEGADIIRCESGMVVEHWGFSDKLVLLRQLEAG